VSKAKRDKSSKKKLGQFLTPRKLAKKIVDTHEIKIDDKILEPSFGNGSFLFPIIEKLLAIYDCDRATALDHIFDKNIYGVEIDEKVYREFFHAVKEKYDYTPSKHNLILSDYFDVDFGVEFDHILGNPPFGGVFDKDKEDNLDKKYGKRFGKKIKKETYCFFTVSCVEKLKSEGEMSFICSDTFLSINTMSGLRNFLLEEGDMEINPLSYFSEETNYGMVVFKLKKQESEFIKINDKKIEKEKIRLFPNLSFTNNVEHLKYFNDTLIGDLFVCSSGMTVGKNEFFIRKIIDNKIVEDYDFSFFNDPVSLEKELSKARLNKISERKKKEILEKERNGVTKRNIKVDKKTKPEIISLPHPDYCYYNKSSKGQIYSKPTHVIFWKDEGDAVITYKKNGNWYLHGVGGKKFFKKEGFTWSLISDKIKIRFLESGYILDSGAPIGVPKEGTDRKEIFFVIGWLHTKLATNIMKKVINHTKNIQSKDMEKMPYPHWVSQDQKAIVIKMVEEQINKMKNGENLESHFSEDLERIFSF